MKEIRLKRVYEAAEPDDGFRILVDRVWPRGMTKEQVKADLWLKEAGPSPALRKWFGHDPARWGEFTRRYFVELDARPEVAGLLAQKAAHDRLTLLFSARDPRYNQAVALREYLLAHSHRGANPPRRAGKERGD